MTTTGRVQTVLGDIGPEEVGITLPHEHIFVDMDVWFFESKDPELKSLANEPVSMQHLWWIWQNPFSNMDNLKLEDEALAIEELELFKRLGGSTVVDLTSRGLGRNPEGLARVSRATGLNIVMGAGYYVSYAQGPDYEVMTEEETAEEIIAEIESGVGEEGIRAGIIGEIGCSWPLNDTDRKSLTASAHAQEKTGAAISIHPGHHEESPLEIADFLRRAGAELDRVIMSHMDRIIHPISVRRELADMGVCLEYDLFGSHIFNPIELGYGRQARPCDRERIEQIIEMMDKGYAEKILISHDMCMKIKLTRYGGCGYHHILRNIVPHMRVLGVSEEQVKTIMVENPKRLLELAPAGDER